MKWVVLVIVVILVAPTIAKRLETLDPDKRDQADAAPAKKRGIVYRSVARFGMRRVFWAFVLIVLILAAGVYLLIHSV